MLINSFYLLFKSNAKETTRDIRETERAGKDLEENLAKQNKQAEELGKNFTKIVEGLTSAATAYISFSAIKAGILNTAAFNTELQRTHEFTGQSVNDLAVYGSALERFGGTAEGFQSAVRSMTEVAAQQGRQLPPIAGFLRDINREFQGLSLNEQNRRGQMLGITDPAMLNLLRQAPEAFDALISSMRELNPQNEKGTRTAQEFERAWMDVKDSFRGVFTVIGNDVLPVLSALFEGIASFGKLLQGNSIFSEAFLLSLATVMTLLSRVIAGSLVAAVTGFGGAAAAASAPILGFASAIMAIVTAAGLLPGAALEAGRWIGRQGNKLLGRGDANGNLSPQEAKDAMAFWKAQGYSEAQAAGIAANEQRESSGDPNAVGDSGRSRGLYQWSKSRRDNILKNTGIDVYSASADDQRRAAAWELQNTGIANKIRNAQTPEQSASIFSQDFERPANSDQEAMIRSIMAGKIAVQDANSSPFNSTSNTINNGGGKSVSVKIDNVNVQTQATDADGISQGIAQGLHGHLQTAISNSDDGVAM